LALFGPERSGRRCPFAGAEQTSQLDGPTSENDPETAATPSPIVNRMNSNVASFCFSLALTIDHRQKAVHYAARNLVLANIRARNLSVGLSMSLLGKAAVAMWWNVRLDQRSEFGDWHSHEHFPERMSIPGFRRGSRWTSTLDVEGFFVLYELEKYEILTSKGYLDRLNAPTVWSTKMMPHHLNMVRSQCRVGASFGGGVATSLATIRLSPEAGRETSLETAVLATLRELASTPGLTGAHLLITDTPKTSVPTTEQQIRGLDGAADWIVLVSGYDPEIVELVISSKLPTPALRNLGAQENVTAGHYRLAFTMNPQDVAATA
jgi:hypothetical protein